MGVVTAPHVEPKCEIIALIEFGNNHVSVSIYNQTMCSICGNENICEMKSNMEFIFYYYDLERLCFSFRELH